VRIDLKGTTIEISHDAHQISILSAAEHIAVLARGCFIEPETVTLEQVNSGQFNLKLVRIEGVEFREDENEWNVWGDYLTFSTLASLRDLFDCHEQTVKVLTSGHSTFAARKLPKGNGSMIAIASIYNSTMQLLVRNIDEVEMEGKRCDGTGGDEVTVLSETFEENMGGFTVYNKMGENVWQHNAAQKCMQMSKSNPPEANEDWLISPALNFSDVATEASISFQHAIVNTVGVAVSPEYMQANHTVFISFNYTSGDPTNADWTQVLLSDDDLPSGSNWTMAPASLALPNSVLGQKDVRVACKYTCNATESTTWRISNVLIKGK
jgi:hypothetical protein